MYYCAFNILLFKEILLERSELNLFAATEADEKIQSLAGFSDVKRASNRAICNNVPSGVILYHS